MPRSRKSHSGLLLLVVIVVLAFSSGLIQYDSPIRVQMMIIDGAGGTLTHVADTWQEWTIHYRDGRVETKRSDKTAITFQAIQLSGEPSAIRIRFPIRLTFKLPTGSCWGCTIGGQTWYPAEYQMVMKIDPIVIVLVDGRPVGSSTSFQPITFTPDDSVGTEKSWWATIQFSGTPSPPSGDVLVDARGALSGKPAAVIQVVMGMVWTEWKVVGPSLLFGISVQEVVSRYAIDSPYALSFAWTPALTGTATFTWVTGILTTTTDDVPIIVWTATGTQTVTLPWGTATVTATLVGPPTTVVQTVGAPLPSDQDDSAAPLRDFCDSNPAFAWLCGSTFGIPNWLLVGAGVLIVLIGVFWPGRRVVLAGGVQAG